MLVGGETWTACVEGRCGTGLACTPLLLLGFRRPGASISEREVLVVARMLQDLSEAELAQAFGRSHACPKDRGPKDFFPEAQGRRKGR